jgi:hypothetical protein
MQVLIPSFSPTPMNLGGHWEHDAVPSTILSDPTPGYELYDGQGNAIPLRMTWPNNAMREVRNPQYIYLFLGAWYRLHEGVVPKTKSVVWR